MKKIIIIILFVPGLIFSQGPPQNNVSDCDSLENILYRDTVTPETLLKILSCAAQSKKTEALCLLQQYQFREDEKSLHSSLPSISFGHLLNCFIIIEFYNEDPEIEYDYGEKNIKSMKKIINKFVREYSEIEIIELSDTEWNAGREYMTVTYRTPNKNKKKRKMRFVKDAESTLWYFVSSQKETWELSLINENFEGEDCW